MSVSMFNRLRHYDNDFNVMSISESKMDHHHHHLHHHHHSVPRSGLEHVRRNLFGPVDRKECSRFAEEELAKHQMSASQKWGFDFVRGCPLDDTKLFLWERVPPTNEIPEMYALSRAAHIRPIEPDRTPSKKRRQMRRDSFLDLYDELAEQSNRYNDSSKSNVLDLSFEDVDGGHTSASSCDEDSFEEEIENSMLCKLSWMPTPSKLQTGPVESINSTEICQANISGLPPPSNQNKSRISGDTSYCDKIINSNFSISRTKAGSSNDTRVLRNSPRARGVRQCKITDFLKERKRLQPTQKKISPKKARISPTSTILTHFRPSTQ